MRQVLARAKRQDLNVAFLFLDLDGFKPVNDTLGHKTGDEVLTEVARRLSAIVREDDTLARIGGDEFAIVMGDLSQDLVLAKQAAEEVANRCIAAIQDPFVVNARGLNVGLSIGIALGDGQSTIDQLMSNADNAMYAAKKSGGSRFALAWHG
jgi:diguanylate cyclase (GGDEF)-like protein